MPIVGLPTLPAAPAATPVATAPPEPAPVASPAPAPPVAPVAAPGHAAPPATPPGTGLRPQDARLAPGRPAPPPRRHVLEHRGVLQHVRQDHEPDLGAPGEKRLQMAGFAKKIVRPENMFEAVSKPDVDVLQLGDPAVPVGHGDARHLAVHVVLRLNQLASINLNCAEVKIILSRS